MPGRCGWYSTTTRRFHSRHGNSMGSPLPHTDHSGAETRTVLPENAALSAGSAHPRPNDGHSLAHRTQRYSTCANNGSRRAFCDRRPTVFYLSGASGRSPFFDADRNQRIGVCQKTSHSMAVERASLSRTPSAIDWNPRLTAQLFAMDRQFRSRRLGLYLVCMPPSICPTRGIVEKLTILLSKQHSHRRL
jgi:hypothetical protein